MFSAARTRLRIFWGGLMIFILLAVAPAAHAATSAQITALQQANAGAAAGKQRLGRTADSLTATIASQQAEIAALDSQIAASKNNIDVLQQRIGQQEAELAAQRQLLAADLRVMYTEHDISTLEMLASSQNFSSFFDKEQYRTSVGRKVDQAAKRIEQLLLQLAREKQSVQHQLSDQQAMQSRLGAQRAENSRLLGLNVEQQQAYQAGIDANNAQIAALERRQAALNNRGFAKKGKAVSTAPAIVKRSTPTPHPTGSNTYPWADVPFPNTLSDPWGMYKRQCVSYAAWKVASSGRHMPYWGGRGDAKQWDDNARGGGIPVDGTPHPGDVAISNAGAWGHAMYVEAVNGDGTIDVSQYNVHLDGRYSEGRRSVSGLSFIHF